MFDLMMGGFGLFNFMFMLVFGMVFVLIVFQVVRGITQWNKNNHSPRLCVDAYVVSKRKDISHHHHHHNDGMHHTTTSTTYYVTFEVESFDRLEFHVSGSEYGQLAEGDFGKLTFQGTRYLSFERTRGGYFRKD